MLKLTLPKKLIDLSNRQLKAIAVLKLKNYPETQFLTFAFLYLSGLKVVKTGKYYAYGESQAHWYRHKLWKKPFIIESLVFQEMIQKVDFLLQEGECKPLRSIGWSRPYNYRLYNAPFEAYLMAENYFQAFSKTQKVEYLDCLIATVYRLPFQKFDSDKIKARAGRFSRVPMPIKLTVYMWYAGFRKYVMGECPNLFRRSGGGTPVKIKEQINSMMRMLNKGYINDNPGIKKALVWDALYEMEAMAKEYEDMKKNVKT